jgi:hypothetical protein
MRDTHGSFSGTVPADMESVLYQLHSEYPALAYMGPVETDRSDWTDEELDSMGAAIFDGLLSGRL